MSVRLVADDLREILLLHVDDDVRTEVFRIRKPRMVASRGDHPLRAVALHRLDERESRDTDALHEHRRAYCRRIAVDGTERADRRLKNRPLLVRHHLRHLATAVVWHRNVLRVAAVERRKTDLARLGAEVLVARAAFDADAATD